MGSRNTFYRHTGVVLARASTAPGGLALPPDLTQHAAADGGRDWLAQVWHREDVRAALKVASPVVSQQIESVLAGQSVGQRHLRRLLGTVSSYLRRWQRRATPFGLFAGVAAASTGSPPTTAGGRHRVTARPDARWLGSIVDDLEQRPDVLFRLPVVANNAATVRGDRLIVPTRPDEARPHHSAALDLSVRLTPPVRVALAAAEQPVTLAAVCDHLAERFPRTPRETIRSLLVALVDYGALITSLRAPMTTVDPLRHLIAELEDAGTEIVPEVADLLKHLTDLHADLPRNAAACSSTRAGLNDTAERMRSVHTTGTVLAVDVGVDEPPAIPEAALAEAESAASALLRLTPHPFGTPAWRDYHQRFLHRYGTGSCVPVREVIADSGLGFPAGWLGAARPHSPHMLTELDSTLLGLIQHATAAGHREITLTDQLLEQLRVGDHEHMLAPDRVEVAFQLHSPSTTAMQRGRFQLWVTGALHPGSMAGRFAHLLPAADQQHLAGTYTSDDEHTLTAQLSFPPRREHNENIARVPQLLPHVIPLAEHRGEHSGVIELDDLAVTADHRSMGLVRLSTGQRVRPWVLHALQAQTHTPPLARFLAELPSACSGFYGLVDVGAAREMPMLPRLRYGRTVLSPAQWRLPQAELPTAAADMDTWENALSTWRERWHIPANVLLVEGGEQRLPLDLEDRGDRALLRHRLERNRSNHVLLRETGGHEAHAWSGRVCEFVAPLTTTRTTGNHPRSALRRAAANAVQLPGTGAVLRADLLGHPWRFNEVLTTHLPHLLASLAEHTRRWWFSRHHDPHRPDSDQYLALFFRPSEGSTFSDVAARVAEWAAHLREAGLLAELSLSTHREPATYGGPAAVEAAEEIFTADSAAALAQLHWANASGLPVQATAAVSLTEFAAALASTPEAGYRWLTELLAQERGKLDRSLRDAALRLAGDDPLPQLATLPGGQDVATAWQRRREAVTAYRDQHGSEADPATVLRTLLREHHLRAVGVDPGTERLAHRLARAVAQRHLALRTGSTP